MVNIPRVVYYLASANRRLYWDKDKLRRFQDKRLRQVVRYAYDHVPFYNHYFRKVGLDPSSIRGICDLNKLPVIKKQELKRQNPEELVSEEYDIRTLKKVRTSGSTGKPFQVYINGKEDAWRKAIYMRANIACGQKPRDCWVVMTSPHHFNDTTKIQRKLGIFAQTCISLFESTDTKLNEIADAKPDVLDGYSGSLYLLAREVKKRGLSVINPRIMFGSSELIDLQSRRYMEEVFNAPFCDQLGAGEVNRTAWQCLERQGYHMDVDSVITEFLNENGETVSDGKRGEVVYTSLYNFTMPFIRYAIGDVGAPSDESCPCGRTLPLMKMIEGRKDSLLKLPGNRIVSPMVFNYAISSFKYYADIDQYRIRQRGIDFFEVLLKMVEGWVEKEDVFSEFESHVKKFLNFGEDELRFKISIVNQIPLSSTGRLLSVSSDLKFNI